MNASIRKKIFKKITSIVHKNGFALVKWDQKVQIPALELPEGAGNYLVKDNPKLLKLIADYNTIDPEVTGSFVWNWREEGFGSELLHSFRGDRAFFWQLRGVDIPELRYLTSTYYQLANDKLGLLNKFKEDALFGNHIFQIAGRAVSREVLDSANEINFLERNLSLSSRKKLKVLDIGAGYGRLAHRFSDAYENLVSYYCTDGVPLSTFICDYYLNYRKLDKAKVIPMTEIEHSLSEEEIHVAMNIHSFSECTLKAIDWWVRTVASLRIQYLMIVPNPVEETGSRLLTNKREDFSPILEKYNYKLIRKEPKYSDPLMQKLGLFPTHYYLFEKS